MEMPTGQERGNGGRNTGHIAGGNRNGMRMQRVPPRQYSAPPPEEREALPAPLATPSPIVNMARRIRDEQGVSGLREFIGAMEPFAAPNELRALADSFGLDYAALREREKRENPHSQRERQDGAQPAYGASPGAFGQAGPFAGGLAPNPGLLQLMQLMSAMNGMNAQGPHNGTGAGNPMQLFQLMQLMPMLQGIAGGAGNARGAGNAPDISQLMKMMGGG